MNSSLQPTVHDNCVQRSGLAWYYFYSSCRTSCYQQWDISSGGWPRTTWHADRVLLKRTLGKKCTHFLSGRTQTKPRALDLSYQSMTAPSFPRRTDGVQSVVLDNDLPHRLDIATLRTFPTRNWRVRAQQRLCTYQLLVTNLNLSVKMVSHDQC